MAPISASLEQEAPTNDDLAKTASMNLAKTGSTGLGANMDATTGALAKMQAITASGGGPNEIAAYLLKEPIPEIRQKAEELMLASQQDAPMSPEHALAAAILQIAPIIIGASVAGKQGAGIGAASGAQGGLYLTKSLEEENARNRNVRLAQAKSYDRQADQLTTQAMGFQKQGMQQEFQSEEKVKDRQNRIDASRAIRPGVTNIRLPDAGLNKQIRNDEIAKEFLQDTIQYIDKNFANEKGYLDIAQRKLDQFFSTDEAGTKAKIVESKLEETAAMIGKSSNSGAFSEEDRRVAREIVGKKTNYTLAQTAEILKDIYHRAELRQRASIRVGMQGGFDVTGYESGGYPSSIKNPPAVGMDKFKVGQSIGNFGGFNIKVGKPSGN